MVAVGLNQVLGRHLDPQVDDTIAVVGKDYVNQILAYVVNIALYRGKDDGAAGCRLAALHQRLQVGDRRLHDLRRTEHFSDD